MLPMPSRRIVTLLLSIFFIAHAGSSQQRTYCNPINIDYGYCPIPNFSEQGKHRATADPVITVFKGNYYLFSTNQWGYWWSPDMLHWNFVPRRFLKPWHKVYDELCAPATLVLGDTLSEYAGIMSGRPLVKRALGLLPPSGSRKGE